MAREPGQELVEKKWPSRFWVWSKELSCQFQIILYIKPYYSANRLEEGGASSPEASRDVSEFSSNIRFEFCFLGQITSVSMRSDAKRSFKLGRESVDAPLWVKSEKASEVVILSLFGLLAVFLGSKIIPDVESMRFTRN